MRRFGERVWVTVAKALGPGRAYRIRSTSWRYGRRLVAGAKAFSRLTLIGRIALFALLLVVLEAFWLMASLSGRVVVLPFDAYGEKDADALGGSIAASMTLELNGLRDLYSPGTELRMAERLTNIRAFSRQVVIPRLEYVGKWQPLAVKVEPLRLGPVSVPVHKLAEWVPKFGATVMTGSIEQYGKRLRLVVTVSGEPEPFVVDGQSADALFSAVELAAHQVVARRWTVNATQRPESLVAFTQGLRDHLDYVVSRKPEKAAAARRHYRDALSFDRAWDLPRLNLASLLYDQFEPDAMREAWRLFREVAAANPTSVAAITGQLNAATQMLERFYGTCDTAPEDLDVLLGAWNTARSLSPNGLSFVDEFNLHLARGIAAYLFGRLQHRHRCAADAAAKLSSFDAVSSFELAEAELSAAERALERLREQRRSAKPHWSIALRDLPVVDREYADFLEFTASRGPSVDHARRARAVVLLERARTRTEEVVKNPSEPYMHGFLAEILLELSRLDTAQASRLIAEAMRQFELERALASDPTALTWANLRLSETAMSMGDWPNGMRTFVDALQEFAKPGIPALLRECSRHGLFVVRDKDLKLIAALLEKAVSDRYDWLSSIGHALLAEVYSRQGRHSEALAKADRAREIVDPRRLRGTRLWYGPELQAKIVLARAKVQALHGDVAAAGRDLEEGLNGVRGRDSPILLLDVIDLAEAMGKSETAAAYRARLLSMKALIGEACLARSGGRAARDVANGVALSSTR